MAIATMLNIMNKLKLTDLYTLKKYIYSILLSLCSFLPGFSFNNINLKVKLALKFFTNMYST